MRIAILLQQHPQLTFRLIRLDNITCCCRLQYRGCHSRTSDFSDKRTVQIIALDKSLHCCGQSLRPTHWKNQAYGLMKSRHVQITLLLKAKMWLHGIVRNCVDVSQILKQPANLRKTFINLTQLAVSLVHIVIPYNLLQPYGWPERLRGWSATSTTCYVVLK